MSGTAGSRAVGLAAAPILSRIYAPADFALLALVTALAGVLIPMSALSYDQAIAVARRDAESTNLLAVSLLLVLIVSGLALAPVWLFREELASLFNNPELAVWFWAVPLFVLARGWVQSLSYFCIRHAWFTIVSAAAMAGGIVTAASKIGLAFAWQQGPGSLLLGAAVGLLASVAVFASMSRLRPAPAGAMRIARPRMLASIRRYREFPLFNSWTTLLNAMSENMNILLFSAFFTPAVVGAYSFAVRTVSMPSTYLGTHVYKVFLSRAARSHRDGENLDRSMLRATAALFVIGALPFGVLALFGRELFGFVFGAAWSEAGRYAELLAPALLLAFVNSPATSVLLVLRRVGIRLAYSIVYMIARLSAVAAAYVAFSDIEACISAFSAVVVLFNLVYMTMAWLIARPPRDLAQQGECKVGRV